MADGRRDRTAAEREAARRERANRRARREGQPVPYEQTADDVAADAPVFDPPSEAEPVAPPGPAPVTPREPGRQPVAPPEPAPVTEPAPEPAPASESAPASGPAPASQPAPASAPVSTSEPASTSGPAPTSEPAPAPEPDADPVTDPHLTAEPAPSPQPQPTAPAPAAAAAHAAATDRHATDGDPLVESRDAPRRPIRSFPSPPDPEFYVPDEELETPSGTRRVSRGAGGGSSTGRRGRGSRRPPAPPRRTSAGGARRPRRWWPRLAALVVALLVVAVVGFAIEIFQPFHGSAHGAVTVRIPQDTSTKQVATLLHRDKVIGSSFFFELRAELDGDRGRIRAGTYHLQQGMSYGAVLSALTKAPKAAKTSQLTLAEGHTRQYVAALLKRQHVRGSYLAATVHSKLLDPRSYGAPRSTKNLEGFLFPDTYSLVDPIRASALVADQLKDFKRRFAGVNLAQAHRLHLSAYDVVTIASLIEAESASPRDDRLVASVIVNRLRDHMMLQLDSTARYATGNFTHDLTERQLQSRSPYNTHTHFGLPPGPINSPGLTALNAAAHPASSRYLYFFSKPCTDQTVFATSYAQFQILLVRDHRSHCPK